MNKITSHTAQDIDRILENIQVRLENNDSPSLRSFAAVLDKGRPLIVDTLASTGEDEERDLKTQRGLADHSRKTLLDNRKIEQELMNLEEISDSAYRSHEQRISELTSFLSLEIQSLRDTAKECEQKAQEDASRSQSQRESTLGRLRTLLEESQHQYNSMQGSNQEIENHFLSMLHRSAEELDHLLREHTAEEQTKQRQTEVLLEALREDETQLAKLEQHFNIIDQDLRSRQEDEAALEKVRSMEEAAYRILIDAATQIQRLSRGRKVRTDVAKAKAKAKKSKGKKKLDKKKAKMG